TGNRGHCPAEFRSLRDENVRYCRGLAASVVNGSSITLVPAVSGGSPITNLSQKRGQPHVPGPADGKPRAVTEDGCVTVFGVQFQLRQPIDIQNVGTMDAHELRWIQGGFDVGKRLLLQISIALRSNRDVTALSFN